jgi:adenylate cyclase
VGEPALILVADDVADNREILAARLSSQGFRTIEAGDGEAALAAVRREAPDLILLDVMMPKLDGLEVCRLLRADPEQPYIPIILVTAKVGLEDIVAGLDAGADEYLTKPVEQAALVARVRSILRTKRLHDEVTRQAAELAAWNEALERRVAEQVQQLERLARLRRFVAPQVADLILARGGERLLASHRAEVVVLFCDLRGFTAFAEQASPDAVMRVLGEYHSVVGRAVHRYEGTLERFLGDGLMVLFNDPVPCAEPEHRAVRLALDVVAGVGALAAAWLDRGFRLGCGIGVARGEATLGTIGFEGRSDYAAIGSVANLAARLCAEAGDGDILVSAPVADVVRRSVAVKPAGNLALKGFAAPISAFSVRSHT